MLPRTLGRIGLKRPTAPSAALALVVLALFVAGCGATTTVLGGGHVPSTAAPGATASLTKDATATAIAIPTETGGGISGGIKGTSVRPCSGPSASAADTAGGAKILSEQQASGEMAVGTPTPTAVRVGDVIQIRLTATTRWTLTQTTGPVSALDPQAAQDSQINACFWNFKATAPGDATLMFTGAPLCEGGAPCPQWAREETFAIHIS